MFKGMRIRYKLLIGYSIVFFLSISIGSAFVYLLVRENIKSNIESELNNTTNAILNLVQTSAAVSIKNHLRAVAEKNLELVRYHYNQFNQGLLTEEEARQRVASLLLSQTIGESGYIYCLDSLVIFNYIPEYDWIVGSSSYLDEFNRPLKTIRNLIFATVVATLILVLPITFKISASITDPLYKLMHHFSKIGASNFTSRMKQKSRDEIGQLIGYFNRSMAKLERYHTDLTKEIEVRRKTEEDLRESEERYRTVMEATPDPIVVYDMQGRVTYLNPAFTRLFGWTLEQCLGKKMDHFVPDEKWGETARMIAAVASGKTLTSTQTYRYDKAGNIIHVSISGSTYRDSNGELAGSVIILRDITRSKRLQKQVMNIGDRERQNIGQDLHDDLCPHLIGIQGLSSVLGANLGEASSPDATLAKQIETLVGEAVEKTRSLTRGLCPVHMVSHGLEAALKDLAEHTESVSGIACRFICEGAVAFGDNTTATHLYYIVQEAVNNAVRHSGTGKVTLSLSGKEERIEISVRDEGTGIPARLKKEGIGLQIMPYRAKMIGAEFNIDSDPEKGTLVQVLMKKEAFIPEGRIDSHEG